MDLNKNKVQQNSKKKSVKSAESKNQNAAFKNDDYWNKTEDIIESETETKVLVGDTNSFTVYSKENDNLIAYVFDNLTTEEKEPLQKKALILWSNNSEHIPSEKEILNMKYKKLIKNNATAMIRLLNMYSNQYKSVPSIFTKSYTHSFQHSLKTEPLNKNFTPPLHEINFNVDEWTVDNATGNLYVEPSPINGAPNNTEEKSKSKSKNKKKNSRKEKGKTINHLNEVETNF